MFFRSVAVVIALSLSWFSASAFGAITVTDSLGKHEFKQPATRVVALNWGATEQLLELGVAPIGAADLRGYRDWVVKPGLPDNIVDVGQRGEPNVERILSLKPDLIIIGSQQRKLMDKLSQVAPVLYFDTYREDHNNAEAIDHSFIELGKALAREQQAIERLELRAERISAMKEKLLAHFGGDIPDTSLVRFVDTSHVRIYGTNSMVEAALDELGIKAAIEVPNSQWGQVQKKIIDLAVVTEGAVFYIKPFPYEKRLFSMPLWQQMPFVKAGRAGSVEPSWTYGGSISIEYIAEAITESLLKITP